MIHVVGGTYLELCPERKWFELFGSGLRASVALARLQAGVHFTTFAGANQKDVLLGRAENMTLHPIEVEKTIGFHYFHTLSKPVVDLYRFSVNVTFSDGG